MKTLLATCLLIVSSSLLAQEAIPSGTILPLELASSIRTNKVSPGQKITGRIMQDVPLPDGSRIRSGARITGSVISVERKDREGTHIVLRFDAITFNGQNIPITTNLRALAGMTEVEAAQVPTSGPDRGTSEFDWNTNQIGGEVHYHGAVITQGLNVVGRSVPPQGVLAHVSSVQGTSCRGDVDGRLQALWVFASTACGVYGYPELTLAHAGRTAPVGEIVLVSPRGNVNIRSGSGMLLRVNSRGSGNVARLSGR